MDKQKEVVQKGRSFCIYHSPSAYRWLGELVNGGPPLLQSLVGKLNGHIEGERNRRDQEYMKKLGTAVLPTGLSNYTVLSDVHSINELNLDGAENIVLFWPDANGLSWSSIERYIFKRKSASVAVWVLNGRGRYFELTPSLWRKFKWRRFLEKGKILEWAMLAGFVVGTPFLLIYDLFRRRW